MDCEKKLGLLFSTYKMYQVIPSSPTNISMDYAANKNIFKAEKPRTLVYTLYNETEFGRNPTEYIGNPVMNPDGSLKVDVDYSTTVLNLNNPNNPVPQYKTIKTLKTSPPPSNRVEMLTKISQKPGIVVSPTKKKKSLMTSLEEFLNFNNKPTFSTIQKMKLPVTDFKMKVSAKFNATTNPSTLKTGRDFIPPCNAMFGVYNKKPSSQVLESDLPKIPVPYAFNWNNLEDVRLLRYFGTLPTEALPRMSDVVDQGACGSCYAISTVTHFDDRWNIWNLGNRKSSYQQIIDCMPNGCDGGYPYEVCLYLEEKGIAPYEEYTGRKNVCVHNISQQPESTFKALSGNSYSIGEDDKATSQEEIKREIYENGPVVVGMAVFADLQQYNGGVYKCNSTEMAGLHAVVITGWEKDCWIVRNSWGSEWGENGYFRIAFGECGIDSFDLKKYMEESLSTPKFSAKFREIKYGGAISAIPSSTRVKTEGMDYIRRLYYDVSPSVLEIEETEEEENPNDDIELEPERKEIITEVEAPVIIPDVNVNDNYLKIKKFTNDNFQIILIIIIFILLLIILLRKS